jgi:hypothetical protein
MNMQEFVYVDWHDKSNWMALALAAFLFWWGVTNIIKALSTDLIFLLI